MDRCIRPELNGVRLNVALLAGKSAPADGVVTLKQDVTIKDVLCLNDIHMADCAELKEFKDTGWSVCMKRACML